MKRVLLQTVDPLNTLTGKKSTEGRVNVIKAVRQCATPGVEFGGEPEFADVEGGETTKFTLTPRALGGVTETPTVQATGLPAGVTATMGGMMAFGTGTALTALAVTPGAMDVVRGGSGPVTVPVEGLSGGMTATPVTIASGATTGNPVFVATAGAPGGRGR